MWKVEKMEGDVYVNTRGNEMNFVFICGCRQITCRPIYVINIDDGGWNFPLLLFGQQPDESYILSIARAPALYLLLCINSIDRYSSSI